MFKFYNAGDKIDEVLSYSLPEGHDIHVIARWQMTAPAKDFFEVPHELELGRSTIHVEFARDITRKFGVRGVVLIDARHKTEKESDDKPKPAFAASDEQAMARGKELWEKYTRTIVEQHLNDCEASRAAGGAPRAAIGFTKRCLKLHGITDPSEQYFNSLRAGGTGNQNDNQVAALQAQMNGLMAVVLASASGQKLDVTTLRAVMPENFGVPQQTTSGIATGKTKPEPEGRANGLEHLKKPVNDKKSRNAKAAAEL